MKTMLLDRSAWDVVLDAQGNWAIAGDPYSLAQDAASACRTLQGEVYYDRSLGVPYFQQILGRLPSAQVIKASFVREAKRVPGVLTATCFLQALANRQLTGQVQVTSAETGQVVAATSPFVPPGVVPPRLIGQLDFTDPRQSGWIGAL